jgi:hypothetical protein
MTQHLANHCFENKIFQLDEVNRAKKKLIRLEFT